MTGAGIRWSFVALGAAFLTVSASCAKKQELVVQSAAKRELTAEDIDRDPLALLPRGVIGLYSVDAQKLFASEFGPKLLELAQARVSIPPSSGFEPRRDLNHVYVGSYSMQGVDVVAVLKGAFDPAKIEQAAGSTQQTPVGAPVVKSSYAGRNLYTAENAGFVVLTTHTVLAGTETGLRRALDRIHDARLAREIPDWMERLVSTPNAAVVGALDFRTQPAADALRRQLAFLNGLETAQFVGNFEAPGLNFAGTLSYGDEAAAVAGADSVRRIRETLRGYSFLMAIFGIAQPVERLEAQPHGKDAQFVVGLNGQAVARLLDKAEQFLKTPGQPIPATLSSGVSGP